MVFRKIFVEIEINNLKNDGFDYSHISEMNFKIVCNKMDMTYDFYMKHNMSAVECKLINKLPASWIHSLNRNFKSYRF